MSHSFVLAEAIRPSMLLDTSRQMATSMFLAGTGGLPASLASARGPPASTARDRAAASRPTPKRVIERLLMVLLLGGNKRTLRGRGPPLAAWRSERTLRTPSRKRPRRGY